MRSAILGNIVYGIVGKYAGFSDKQLNEATSTKKTWRMIVDPNDEAAYKAGADIYGGGFEDVFNVTNVCAKVNEVLDASPSALHEGRSDGDYNDLSSCKPCTEKTKETRHGGNEETRWRP